MIVVSVCTFLARWVDIEREEDEEEEEPAAESTSGWLFFVDVWLEPTWFKLLLRNWLSFMNNKKKSVKFDLNNKMNFNNNWIIPAGSFDCLSFLTNLELKSFARLVVVRLDVNSGEDGLNVMFVVVDGILTGDETKLFKFWLNVFDLDTEWRGQKIFLRSFCSLSS